MRHSIGISYIDKQILLKKIQKDLKLFYSPQESDDIIKIMSLSIDDFIEKNPLCSLNDLETYIQKDDIFSDWIQHTNLENIISKINTTRTHQKRKKIIIITIILTIFLLITTFTIGHFIMYVTAENVKTIIIP